MKIFARLAAAAFCLFQLEKAASQALFHSCGHDAVVEKAEAEQPDFLQKQAEFEAFWLEKVSHPADAGGERAPFLVPVVFHVIHQNGPENLSAATIQQAVDFLNAAFSNSGAYAGGLGTDAQIQFCLARQRPDGSPSTGIERVENALTDAEYGANDGALKNLSRYDPTRYLNIWTVRSLAIGSNVGVAGYSTLPGSAGFPSDGIVMEAEFVGATSAGTAGLAHEAGHYLGLLHTFSGGCANGNCLLQGDRICDTPPDQSTAWAPCGGPFPNSCATDVAAGSPFSTDQPDMISNFMDYGDWSCFADFTAEQGLRMRTALETIRKSLLASSGCAEPCPAAVTASFSAPATVQAGETILFQSQSTGAATLEWRLNGQSVGVGPSFSTSFSAAGFFWLELVATGPGGCATAIFRQKVEVICPVVAAFLSQIPAEISVGESIFFQNTSLGAAAFEWKINGQTVAATADFTFSSAAAGGFSICLVAGNGVCLSEKCRFLQVVDPFAACQPTMLRGLGTNAERAGAIALGAGDRIWHVEPGAGLLIEKISPAGLVEKKWSTPDFSGVGAVEVLRVAFDSEGCLLAVGRVFGDGFVFRFDTTTEKTRWLRRFQLPVRAVTDILERGPGGPFLIATAGHATPTTSSSQPTALLELDRATGEPLAGRAFRFKSFFGNQFRRVAAVGDDLFAVGETIVNQTPQRPTRPTLTKIGADGAVLFSIMLDFGSSTVGGHQTATDILADSTGLVVLVQGALAGAGLAGEQFWLLKTDFDGNMIWLREIKKDSTAFGSTAFWAQDLRKLASGFLVGGIESSPFLAKFSENAELVEWTTTSTLVGLGTAAFHSGRLATDGKSHFLVGGSNAGDGLVFLRTDLFGEVELNCVRTGAERLVSTSGVPFGWTDLPMTVGTDSIPSTDVLNAMVLSNAPISTQYCPICEKSCEPPTENVPPADCSKPNFLRAFENVSPNTRLINSRDGSVWATFDGTIVRSSPLGEPIWSRTLLGLNAAQFFSFQATGDSSAVFTSAFLSVGKITPIGYTKWLKNIFPSTFSLHSKVLCAAGEDGKTAFFAVEKADSGCVFLQIFSPDGDTIGQRAYRFGWELGGQPVAFLGLKNGDWLFVGTITNFAGKDETLVVRFDPLGNLRWKKRFSEPSGLHFRPTRAVELADGGLEIMSAVYIHRLCLLKLSADGDLLFAKELTDQNLQIPQDPIDLVATDDGFAMLSTAILHGSLLAVFDLKGEVRSSRLQKPFDGNLVFDPASRQFFMLSQDFNCSQNVLLSRIDSLGRVPGCVDSEAFPALAVDWPLAVDSLFSEEVADRLLFRDLGHLAADNPIQSHFECRSFCLPPPPFCARDLAVRLDSVGCEKGAARGFFAVCNEADTVFEGDVRLLFFEKNPVENAQKAVAADSFFVRLEKGQCLSFSIVLDEKSLKSNSFWAFLMEKAVPFDFEKGSKLDTSSLLLADCRRWNNLAEKAFSRPSPPDFDLGPDRVLCGQNVLEFRAPAGWASYEWSDGSRDSALTVAGEPGLFWLRATDECGAEKLDSVRVAVDSATRLELPDLRICRPTEVKISGDFSKISWSPALGLSCSDCPAPVVEPPADSVQKYLVVAESAGGCLASDTFSVRRGEARVPNAFTPDGDGLNDFFEVFTPENCPCEVVSMQIFNRWGQLVFEKSSFSSGKNTGWDGLFEGKPAPPEVYIFRLELQFASHLSVVETGDVTLVR